MTNIKTFRGSLSLENRQKNKIALQEDFWSISEKHFCSISESNGVLEKRFGSILALFPGANEMLTCF